MSQYLGDISAYALAVSQGYTGTEEEYAELMASYATVGQTAVNAAQTATTKASEAATSATTATNKASEATTAATTATTKAGEASTSASTATSAKDTAVSASQTATTKATEATTAAATATSAATTATTAKDDAVSAKTAAQTAQTGAETAAAGVSASAEQIATNAADISQLKSELTDKADQTDMLKAFPTDTASGSVASFADGANVPVKSLVINIDPVQEGSGDPSPDNVRPISGWGEVNVGTSGKNIANAKYRSEVPSIISGQMVVGNGWSTEYIKVDNSRTYRVSVGNNSTSYLLYYDYNLAFLGGRQFSGGIRVDAESYFNEASYIKLRNDAAENNNPNIQLELGTTSTAYEPYSGQSITIDLGQTVYGGTLDVTNGVLTTYPYYASYNGETLTGAWISDRDKYVSGTTPTTGAQVVNIGGAGTDVQLTPHEVRSLLGSNNIWADTGDSTVTYRADPTLYISRLTEPDADMVADANITSGNYFMVGNTLYKATANIASGATISPNVNCTRKSLSEALNELNA